MSRFCLLSEIRLWCLDQSTVRCWITESSHLSLLDNSKKFPKSRPSETSFHSLSALHTQFSRCNWQKSWPESSEKAKDSSVISQSPVLRSFTIYTALPKPRMRLKFGPKSRESQITYQCHYTLLTRPKFQRISSRSWKGTLDCMLRAFWAAISSVCAG